MPNLGLYTVYDLREWLAQGRSKDGLSEQVISPTRAWAIIHNPYVQDSDPVLSVVFEKEKVAAYTCAFPVFYEGKRFWWFSSLWCNPEYQGRGLGLIVIGSLVEVYGADFCFDRWGAQETVEIFSYLGLKTTFFPRYSMGSKIDCSSVKGRFVHYVRRMQVFLHRQIERPLKDVPYSLRYLSTIDEATYSFICDHRKQYYFEYTREYFNWVLNYPFTISAPLIERVQKIMPFSPSETLHTQFYAVQVKMDNKIVGFYLMKRKDNTLHILYLYLDDANKNSVYASIRDHVKRLHVEQCVTENQDLAIYLRGQVYFPKYSVSEISFSYPSSQPCPMPGQVQYGDGDCFAL